MGVSDLVYEAGKIAKSGLPTRQDVEVRIAFLKSELLACRYDILH